MSDELKGLEGLLDLQPQENKYAQWGIEFNPFPRSGTANINGSDWVNRSLVPFNAVIQQEINRFINDSFAANKVDEKDQFISATIVGDYGSGKTQLLMYVRGILNRIRDGHKFLKPYTIYLDNPGGSILEFIGSIIAKIGEENIRKYVWNHIIEEIMQNDDVKSKIKMMAPTQGLLWQEEGESPDPFNEANTVSYKRFLDAILRNMSTPNRKKFDAYFSGIVRTILEKDTQDTTVAFYFYDFISSDFGINKTWEALTSGSLKQVTGKEFAIIKYIIKLLKREGYTHVYILVDEFEDLTEGRLTKAQLDNYIHNLRTLLDKQREWCLLFAMNPLALDRLKKVSPPLADRISVRQINLDNLQREEMKNLIEKYLSLADYQGETPIRQDAMDYILKVCDGNPRRILKVTFSLFESAATAGVKEIDLDFVERNIPSF